MKALGELLAPNPCRRTDAVVLYRAPNAPPDGELLDRFAFVRSHTDALASEGDDPEGVHRLFSDWYVCVGATTFGSGRAVIVDRYQVKGVGRTVQARLEGPPLLVDGRVRAYKAFDELHLGLLAGRLLSVPTLPTLAVLQRRETGDDDSFLIVRDGLPVRVAHLMFFEGVSYRHTEPERTLAWRRLFSAVSPFSPKAMPLESFIEATFDTILASALRVVAETRILGLSLPNWADNGDLHARLFDFEDIGFHFGTDVTVPDGPRVLRRRRDPFSYFAAVPFGVPFSYGFSALHAIANACLAVGLLAKGIGYDRGALLARYGWPRLHRWYGRALGDAVARLVDVDPSADEVHEAALGLLEAMPLAPERPFTPFRPSVVLESFLARRERKKDLPGREGALGRLLARAPSSSPEGAVARARAVREELDGARRTAHFLAGRAEANAIASKAPPGPAREALYRDLLLRAARVPDPLAAFEAPPRARSLSRTRQSWS